MSDKSRPKGLGRGLNALFDDDEEVLSALAGVPDNPEDIDVPVRSGQTLGVEQLSPGLSQPRLDFDPDALEALAASIKTHGILQPLLVREKRDVATGDVIADQYEIIAGERRWRAAQLAQLHEVPVVIRSLEDEQAMQIALIENLQREDLNPIEEALAYQRLIQEHDYTQAQLAEALGKSRSHIANMTRMLALPESVLELVRGGDLSPGHARCLIPLDAPLPLAQKIIADGMSVRAVEKYVQSMNAPDGDDSQESAVDDHKTTKVSFTAKVGAKQPAKSADLVALERDLSTHIGMNVGFDMVAGSNTEGTMRIDFKTLDQLDLLITALKRAALGDASEMSPHRLMD